LNFERGGAWVFVLWGSFWSFAVEFFKGGFFEFLVETFWSFFCFGYGFF
jgi:hypothetical protein